MLEVPKHTHTHKSMYNVRRLHVETPLDLLQGLLGLKPQISCRGDRPGDSQSQNSFKRYRYLVFDSFFGGLVLDTPGKLNFPKMVRLLAPSQPSCRSFRSSPPLSKEYTEVNTLSQESSLRNDGDSACCPRLARKFQHP